MNQNRIANWSNVSLFIEQGLPVQIPFDGTPWSSVTFNPQTGELRLFIETLEGLGSTPPPVDIKIERCDLPPRSGWVVGTARRDLYFHFYCFICAIVDEMYLRNRPPAIAFEVSVAAFRDLIEKEAVLSTEKQIGLLAELLVVMEVATRKDWAWGLDAWHRDVNAEHDFNLGDSDLEVKATMMESRVHMIGSLQQLEASPERNLFLASFQFTRNDHDDSLKLGDVVTKVRDLIQLEDEALVSRFDERIRKVGYRWEHSRFYNVGVGYRAPSLVFKVDDAFPRIIGSNLSFPVSANRLRISQVSYRTSLENYEGITLEAYLDQILGVKHG
jgi:hypothetical protein